MVQGSAQRELQFLDKRTLATSLCLIAPVTVYGCNHPRRPGRCSFHKRYRPVRHTPDLALHAAAVSTREYHSISFLISGRVHYIGTIL